MSQISDSLADCFILKFQINIDGLLLFNHSTLAYFRTGSFIGTLTVIIALFCGPNKPQSADLKDFVGELQELEKGFNFNGKRLFQNVDSVVICDAPPKSFVKNIKPHNGYYL